MSSISQRLKDLSWVITKGTTPSSIGLEVSETGIPFLRAQNLQEGSIDLSLDPQYISLEVHEVLNRSIIRPKDVLVSIAGTIGRAADVPESSSEMNCNQAVAIIRPKECLDSKYLSHWLRSDEATKQIKSSQVTATISNLSLGEIGNLKLNPPSFEEQRRIAAILDQAEALRAKRRQALAKLDNLTQSLFLEMFESGDDRKRIRDVADVRTGGTPSREVQHNFGGSIPWVKTGEVNGNLIVATEEHLTEAGLKGSNCQVFPKNSLVIAMYGQGKTRGQVALLGIEAATDQACAVILPSTILLPAFLLAQLKLRYHELRGLSRGGNQPNLNLRIVKDFEVLVPSIEKQTRFECRVNSLSKLKALFHLQISKLELLSASLQHRAFRGEL